MPDNRQSILVPDGYKMESRRANETTCSPPSPGAAEPRSHFLDFSGWDATFLPDTAATGREKFSRERIFGGAG